MARVSRLMHRLGCWLMGWHEYWSYADKMDDLPDELKPKASDSTEIISAKFHQATVLRCWHCPYTYIEECDLLPSARVKAFLRLATEAIADYEAGASAKEG